MRAYLSEHACVPVNRNLSIYEYVRKIRDEYDEDSRQFLIAGIYSEFTCSDNLGNFKIISSIRENIFRSSLRLSSPMFEISDQELKSMSE